MKLRRRDQSPDKGWAKGNFWSIAGWAIGLLVVVFGMRDILHMPEWLAIPLGVALFFVCLFVGAEFIL